MSIERATRRSLPSRQHASNKFGSICIFALAAALAPALGATPAAARFRLIHERELLVSRFDIAPAAVRHKFRHPEHKDSERASKEPFGDIPKGAAQIFISIDQQKLYLYSGGVRVADTSIATGVPSLPTPLGVFSVIQKQIFHRSNIYSGAPMPFMQRITWSGVAMHEGEGIGHRASHGCIRMPHDFAVRLYHLTKIGVPVIIARSELEPAGFADPHLFVHQAAPPQPVAAAPPAASVAAQTPSAAPLVSSATLSPTAIGLRVSTDSGAAAPKADAARSDPPVKDMAQFAGPAAAVTSAATSSDPKPATPASMTIADAAKPNSANDAAKSAAPAASVPGAPADPRGLVSAAPANKDPIAIFISRKDKKIFVRQDFAPLFEMPVTIADPDKPVGTQVFTALDFVGDDHTTLRWNVVTLPGEPPPPRRIEREGRYERYARGRRRIKAYEEVAGDAPPSPPPAAVLARIEIPQAAIDFISQLIVPGSSLIVSDHGLGDETGEGTNFIVVTR